MTKGIPKEDGSGKGVRANKGRGGCEITKQLKKGKKKKKSSIKNLGEWTFGGGASNQKYRRL